MIIIVQATPCSNVTRRQFYLMVTYTIICHMLVVVSGMNMKSRRKNNEKRVVLNAQSVHLVCSQKKGVDVLTYYHG